MIFLDMPYKFRLIILFLISLLATTLIFRPILNIAMGKNIVDTPDARKFQKNPVPVMGGIAVFFGIVVGLSFYKTMINFTTLFPVLSAMVIMLYLGSMDDILNINPKLRFCVEMFVALLLLYGMKQRICDFQGLWGIENLPFAVGILLSVITFVGVTNSINMIDGVDGLSSSFCIMILGFFGLACFLAHQFSFAALSAVSIGALLPFFLHNVYGEKTKMFIGDGGTMMIGTAISAFIFVILSGKFSFPFNPEWNFSKVAFVLAVLSIPIADTLRVMVMRICHGKSPFSADRNHMHHILINLKFPNTTISAIEVGMNLLVIFSFFISWILGAGVDAQLYVTIFVAALLDWFLAPFLNFQVEHNTPLAEKLRKLAFFLSSRNAEPARKIKRLVDSK